MWCENLSFEDWEEKYDCNEKIMTYLHGKCDLWVLENYHCDDIPIILCHYDEDMGKLSLIHCFIKRDDFFVDIRGKTLDINNVLMGFEDFCGFNDTYIECTSLEDFKSHIRTICGYTDEIWK